MQLTFSQPQLKNIRNYLASYLALWALAAMWVGWQGRANAFLLLRPQGGPVLDSFFRYITHIGDGLFAIAVAVLFLLQRRFAAAFVLGFGYAVSGVLAQIIKNLVQSPRPSPYFRSIGIEIHPADGVELLQSMTSFPSGHTATIFALMTAMILMRNWWQQRWWQAVLLASLIGYSRIYLGQHFLQDVLAGSMLGVAASFAGYAVLRRWNPPFLAKSK